MDVEEQPRVVKLVPLATLCSAIGVAWLLYNFLSDKPPIADPPVTGSPTRLAIRMAEDPGAASISKTIKPTSIDDMVTWTRPPDLARDISTPSYQSLRVAPYETTLWQVDATLTDVIRREDGDYYLTLRSKYGAQIIAELPPESELGHSAFRGRIVAARQAVERRFAPSAQPKKVSVPVRVTGLGFFGKSKGSENGIKLHPLVDIAWLDEKKPPH